MAQGKPKKGRKTISLSIDSDILLKLDDFCEQDRRSRSSAIEIAIERYFDSIGFDGKGGALDG